MTIQLNTRQKTAAKPTPFIACALAILLTLTALLPLSACSGSEASSSSDSGVATDAAATQSNETEATVPTESQSFTFTDDLNFEVTVTNPTRVIACMGSFANTWELAGGTLIGASDDALADYALSSKDVTSIGDFTAPNLELILSLEPDFVLMTGSSTGRDGAASQTDLRDALASAGITVAYFNVTSFEDYLRMLKVCTSITERSDLFEENGLAVQERIEVIKEAALAGAKTAGEAPTALLMTTYSGGTRVQNSSTMTGIMLAEIGAVNMADENPSLLRDFSLEAIIEINPSFIFVVPMGNDDEAAMKNLKEATEANPAWAALDAVQNGNYQTLDKTLFLYKPNNLWDKSYQTLFDLLYS